MKKRTLHIFGALLIGTAPHLAAAQAYPVKPIRLIFPLNAGSSSNDILGRALAQRLTDALGQSLVADYRPGAAVSGVVHPSLPVTDLKGLVALAKSRPGQINFASSGTGGLPHLAGELFKLTAGVDIVHVPYRSAATAHTDLLGGHVQMEFTGISGVVPSIKAGRLRALAVTAPRRSELLPEVVTAAEAGYPGMDVSSSLGLLTPAGTPPAIVRRLQDEIFRIVNGADMKSFILRQGAEPGLMDGAEFGAHIKSEIAKWARVLKAANVKPE